MTFRNPFSNRNRLVRVYIKEGPSIEGVLAGETKRHYILWAPRIVTETETEPVAVSGHVEVPREGVLWFQILG